MMSNQNERERLKKDIKSLERNQILIRKMIKELDKARLMFDNFLRNSNFHNIHTQLKRISRTHQTAIDIIIQAETVSKDFIRLKETLETSHLSIRQLVREYEQKITN